MDAKRHWEEKYNSAPYTSLGWYEENPEPSLSLIRDVAHKTDRILICGAGASTLVDHLVEDEYTAVMALDISPKALSLTKERLGSRAHMVQFKEVDLCSERDFDGLVKADVWHDRAVLHFFIEEKDRQTYLQNLNKTLKIGGYFIVGVFSNECLSDRCSGLPVHRYDVEMMQKLLGERYELCLSKTDEYIMPTGDERQYIYAVFKRIS